MLKAFVNFLQNNFEKIFQEDVFRKYANEKADIFISFQKLIFVKKLPEAAYHYNYNRKYYNLNVML